MKLFKKRKNRALSGNFAKSRLKELLMSDHVGTSGELIESMKDEIRKVVEKYIDITNVDIEIVITKGNGSNQAC